MQLKDRDLFRQQAYVAGTWMDAEDSASDTVINPATGEKIGTVPRMGAVETRRAIEAAGFAMKAWAAMPAKERAVILRRWADMMVAQSALWTGLLYDDAALTAAEALLRDARWEDAVELRAAVPRLGLDAPWRGGNLRALAADVVAIAMDGLRGRSQQNATGDNESIYLRPLLDIVEGAPTQAEHWLARHNGPWQGDVGQIFTEAAI